jgi:hypothetical protein
VALLKLKILKKKSAALMQPRHKRSDILPHPFQKGLLLLVAGLAFGLDIVRAPASGVVAYGYNMGVAPLLTNAVAVGVRAYSLVALRAEGTIAQWGNGASDPGISDVGAISSGGWPHALGLLRDGSIIGWGEDYGGGISSKPAYLTNGVAVAVGFNTSLVISTDGTVAVWGDTSYNIPNVPAGLTNVTAIAAGNDGTSALALRADGTIMEWGYNGTNSHPELSNIVAVATANAFMNAAVHFDGSVTVWPADGDYPVPDHLTNIVSVAGGGQHMLFLRQDGTVVPWGCDCQCDFTSTTNLTHVSAIGAGGGDGYDYSIFLIDNAFPSPLLTVEMGQGIPRLRISGEPFRHFVLEGSADLSSLANWMFKQNLVLPATGEFTIGIPAASSGAQFYRARLVP